MFHRCSIIIITSIISAGLCACVVLIGKWNRVWSVASLVAIPCSCPLWSLLLLQKVIELAEQMN